MPTQHRDKPSLDNEPLTGGSIAAAPSPPKYAVEVKDLYATLIATRNLEIGLFWQRSNYFLVLNSGMAFGFFKFASEWYALVFGLLGLAASFLWVRTCLGSKFWQTRWEQRLIDFEREQMAGLEFFAASPQRIRQDVEAGLSFYSHNRFKKLIYGWALEKPSVSFSMILLSCSFVVGWLAFIGFEIRGLVR